MSDSLPIPLIPLLRVQLCRCMETSANGETIAKLLSKHLPYHAFPNFRMTSPVRIMLRSRVDARLEKFRRNKKLDSPMRFLNFFFLFCYFTHARGYYVVRRLGGRIVLDRLEVEEIVVGWCWSCGDKNLCTLHFHFSHNVGCECSSSPSQGLSCFVADDADHIFVVFPSYFCIFIKHEHDVCFPFFFQSFVRMMIE